MVGKALHIVTGFSVAFGIPALDILGQGRSKSVVNIRRAAIQKVRQETDLSLSEIGKIFGKRHHTTILHYLKT